MIEYAIKYLSGENGIIPLIVMITLSIYLIVVFWIFFYKYTRLQLMIDNEKKSIDSILVGNNKVSEKSFLYKAFDGGSTSKRILDAFKRRATMRATTGLTFISIIASTSPFIGLFGTVVSILAAFSSFDTNNHLSLNTIAPAISEALVATAAGIFVAIFAYTFHQILQRKAYEFIANLEIQIDILFSKKS